MVNKIADGISVKLNELFGDGYGINTEKVKQGLTEPCFFIKPLRVMTNPLLGRRKERIYPFDIAFFTTDGNEEMMRVGERMLDGLECVRLLDGTVVRCRSPEMEIVDDVLHVSAKYTMILNCSEPKEVMGTIKTNTGTKGE